MKKKIISGIALSVVAAASAFGFAGCTGCGPKDGGDGHYNIIFTNSTNPPTLSALLSIKSNDETYAYIQRGNTYYGIANTSKFHNIGFNIDKQTNQLTQAQAATVADTVKQIAKKKKKATFTIYVTDYNAYGAYAAAYSAGLDDSNFNVVMVEDGTGTYSASNYTNYYITGKTVEESNAAYEAVRESATTNLNTLKQDPTKLGADVPMQDYQAWVGITSVKDNASMFVVGKAQYTTQFETAGLTDSDMYKALKQDAASEYNIEMNEGTSATLFNSLTTAQRTEYLKLIGGDDVVNTLRRTTDIKGRPVSSKKFVIVGSRQSGNTLSMLPDITSASELIPYDEIATNGSAALKEVVAAIFTNKEDYEQVLNILNAASNNYNGAQKVSAFNLFAENKFMYQVIANNYGGDRDLIFKGHPSEVITDRDCFTANNYPYAAGTDGATAAGSYEDAIFKLTNNFFNNDSLGSTIGVALGGCDMSNYAFFGDLDYAIGGKYSSTFASYDVNVPVDLIMSAGASTSYDGAPARYENGTLKDTDGNVTTYLNTGSMYQMLGQESKLQAWLVSTYGVNASEAGNYGVNKQGFVAKRNGTTITDITRNVTLKYNDGTEDVTKAYKNGDILALTTPTRAGYVFKGWFVEGTATEYAAKTLFNNINETAITLEAKWEVNVVYTVDGGANQALTLPVGSSFADAIAAIKAALGNNDVTITVNGETPSGDETNFAGIVFAVTTNED